MLIVLAVLAAIKPAKAYTHICPTIFAANCRPMTVLCTPMIDANSLCVKPCSAKAALNSIPVISTSTIVAKCNLMAAILDAFCNISRG